MKLNAKDVVALVQQMEATKVSRGAIVRQIRLSKSVTRSAIAKSSTRCGSCAAIYRG